MHLKNIISEINQTIIGSVTSLFIGNIYLDEEVTQAELRQSLAEDTFTWLSGLMALAARPITVTPQKHSGDSQNYYWCPIYINIHIILKFETKIYFPPRK
jgi:hypothetical protein